jgi:hypothetical protein
VEERGDEYYDKYKQKAYFKKLKIKHISFFLSLTSFYLLTVGVRRLFLHLITHTDTYILGRTPLDKGSACHRNLYLMTHNTPKRHTSMPLAGFKPAIPASELPQTHALDHVATGIGQK